jgi:hypothetical protein
MTAPCRQSTPSGPFYANVSFIRSINSSNRFLYDVRLRTKTQESLHRHVVFAAGVVTVLSLGLAVPGLLVSANGMWTLPYASKLVEPLGGPQFLPAVFSRAFQQ